MKKPRRTIQNALDREFGPDSLALIAQLKKIAFGEAFTRAAPGLEGAVVTVHPTIAEMHAAVMDLLAYQHGRPRQGLDVEVDDRRQKWNPDALTLAELQEMDRLARKAEAPRVVEGEVIRQLPAVNPQTEKVKS